MLAASDQPRPRILSAARHTSVHGGGELVAAWIHQALQDDYDLTIFGWAEPEWDDLNRFFGTSLDRERIGFVRAPRWMNIGTLALGARHIHAAHFQRYAAFMRAAKKVTPDYDLAITPLDEMDLGVPGLQYIHFPWVPNPYPEKTRPWQRVADFDLERLCSNATAANSRDTAVHVRQRLGVDPKIIYPPCPGDFDPLPWDQRADRVVVVSRLIPSKRFDLAIDTVKRVREAGHELELVFLGNRRGVARREQLAVRRQLGSRDWVRVIEDASRDELIRFICASKYGMHPMPQEPYGIAVAELVRAGCIPLTRRSGGPPEITGPDERLRFDSAEEGAQRLLHLIRSPVERQEVLAALREREGELRPERFVREIQEWVRATAERHGLLGSGSAPAAALRR